MTDRVRVVRTGSLTLDLVLGGGIRLVKKVPDGEQESACLLVRGGPGTGKSVFAQQLALNLAKELGGDVLYACIEVLPTEVHAQRMGFSDYRRDRVLLLSAVGEQKTTGPALALGMKEWEVTDGVPELGRMLLELAHIASQRGCLTKVVVVDSLIEGYKLGKDLPRVWIDDLCKIAAEEGWVLLFIEETESESTTAWEFAVDTVFQLRLTENSANAALRRELIVRKHRFASCEPGPHRLMIDELGVRVLPEARSYLRSGRFVALPPPAAGRSWEHVVVSAEEKKREFLRVPNGVGKVVAVVGSDWFAVLNALMRGEALSGARIFLDLAQRQIDTKVGDTLRLRRLPRTADGAELVASALGEVASAGNVEFVICSCPSRLETEWKEELLALVLLLFDAGFLVFVSQHFPYEHLEGGVVDKWGTSRQESRVVLEVSTPLTKGQFTLRTSG